MHTHCLPWYDATAICTQHGAMWYFVCNHMQNTAMCLEVYTPVCSKYTTCRICSCCSDSLLHACGIAGVQLLTSAMRTWSPQLAAMQAVGNSMPTSATCSQLMAPSSNAVVTWQQISPGSFSRTQPTAASAHTPGQGGQQGVAGLAQCNPSSLMHLLACSVPPLRTQIWG